MRPYDEDEHRSTSRLRGTTVYGASGLLAIMERAPFSVPPAIFCTGGSVPRAIPLLWPRWAPGRTAGSDMRWPFRPTMHSRKGEAGGTPQGLCAAVAEFARDSPLEGTGFELPVLRCALHRQRRGPGRPPDSAVSGGSLNGRLIITTPIGWSAGNCSADPPRGSIGPTRTRPRKP